tara:strand:+ start:2544 stop:3086 length:543 start_codon:yes stop_codon:yes gene_type:complete
MPEKVDEIKDALMADPNFKPQKGQTKEESAWAVATSKVQQMKSNDAANQLGQEAPMDEAFALWKLWKESSSELLLNKQLHPPRPGLVFDPGRRRWVKPDKRGPAAAGAQAGGGLESAGSPYFQTVGKAEETSVISPITNTKITKERLAKTDIRLLQRMMKKKYGMPMKKEKESFEKEVKI